MKFSIFTAEKNLCIFSVRACFLNRPYQKGLWLFCFSVAMLMLVVKLKTFSLVLKIIDMAA